MFYIGFIEIVCKKNLDIDLFFVNLLVPLKSFDKET